MPVPKLPTAKSELRLWYIERQLGDAYSRSLLQKKTTHLLAYTRVRKGYFIHICIFTSFICVLRIALYQRIN